MDGNDAMMAMWAASGLTRKMMLEPMSSTRADWS